MLQAGEVLNGKYRIEGVLGQGGMSVVYRAAHLETGQALAIKDVNRSKQSGIQIFEQQLTEEGRLLKQLDNTHLPRIYDIIENESSFMLVMDYVPGESLDKVIAREGPQSEAYIYNWGMQICDVFAYLHSQTPPIIYRDMKPANVILQPDGKIMMIDFGTARTQKIGRQLSSDTTCMGTEGFAAPEQYGGLGESDARTDIFCLGATLYNLVTGHSPYDPPQGILPLSYWDPELADSPLQSIIDKCTMRSPIDRYQTADELRMDLSLAQAGLLSVGKPRRKSAGMSWQKQRAATGMLNLSGLLKKPRATGLLEQETEEEKPVEQNPPVESGVKWMQASPDGTVSEPAVPGPNSIDPGLGEPEDYTEPDFWQRLATLLFPQDAGLWQRLMVIAAAVALCLLFLGLMFTAARAVTSGLIFLILSIAAVILAAVGMIQNKREQDDQDPKL